MCAFSSQELKCRMCEFHICVRHSYRINRSADCDEKCEKIKDEIAEISKCEMMWYIHSWREFAVVWKYCNILHYLRLFTVHVTLVLCPIVQFLFARTPYVSILIYILTYLLTHSLTHSMENDWKSAPVPYKNSFESSLLSSFASCAFKIIVLHQRPLSTVYDILSLTNFTLLTADINLCC